MTNSSLRFSTENFFKCGRLLSFIFGETLKIIRPEITLQEIEKFADDLIIKKGGLASFKMVPNYHWATCLNLNDGVVHGIPNGRKIKAGDLLSLDLGLYSFGCHTDMAYTLLVKDGKQKSKKNFDEDEKKQFLLAGKKALEEAVKAAKVGNRVGNISMAIQRVIEGAGFFCVRELTGHGIGKKLHQEPWIPCFLLEKIEKTPLLKKGQALAIEVIYTMGSPNLTKLKDGWTISTLDGKISALFEKTVIVGEHGGKEVTPYNWDF